MLINHQNPNIRKTTHPYKSRCDLSSINNNYFIFDNFEFNIESFYFDLHYKCLIEVSIKWLGVLVYVSCGG